MKILDRYIGYNVLVSTLIVILVLMALFTFFTYMDELGRIGRGNYGALQAAVYVLFTLPRTLYQLFPMAALLGSIIGLGILAGNNELTVIRAAGVSLTRIVWSVLKVGILLIILSIIIGEWAAPISERYAQIFRSVALSKNITLKSKSGLWARDGLDYINVKELLPKGRLGDVNIYGFDHQNRLTNMTHAKEAFYKENHWILQNVVNEIISTESVETRTQTQIIWDTSLSPELLSVVIVKPDTLSVVGLYQYIHYLRDNGLNSDQYELAFWSKLISSLVTGVMVFLSIPFVFGPLRSVGIGTRILVGALLGTGFYLFNQVFSYVALVYNFNPIFGAGFPTLLFLALAIFLMRRVQ